MKHLSETFNRDCVEAMKEYPDNYFDLAVVDPPYGLDIANANDTKGGNGVHAKKAYTKKNWDKNIPEDVYFLELFRVSKNQIVWGANYFGLIGGYIFWDKEVTMPTFSSGELAFCSLINKVQYVKIAWHGMIQHNMKNKEERIHPTQKPVALYDWIFTNYAKPNNKILDTHLGSQSSRIASYKAGLDFTGFELDKEYFEQGNKRFNDFLTVYEQEVGKEKILNNQTRLF
jgi:site-specific DNA-methyltransferase (adenine-specific)